MSCVYVVQSFQAGRKGTLIPDVPQQAQSTSHAIRLAERLAQDRAVVVAFVREGDAATGEYQDAKLIAAFGDAPEEIELMERI